MGSEKAVAMGAEGGGDAGNGKAGGVGGEDCVFGEMRENAGEERGLDFKVFGNGFDDPIALGEGGEIAVEIAGRDEGDGLRVVEGGGLGFGQGGEGGPRKALRAFTFWGKVE